jgi:integrase
MLAALQPHEQADGCEDERQNQKDFGRAERHAVMCSSPRVVAERLGHSTPALVMNVYGHVTERMQEQATTALDRVLGA